LHRIFPPIITGTGVLLIHILISIYLNVVANVCMYRDTIFSNTYSAGKLILLYLLAEIPGVAQDSR
jgi:xanthine/uracil permease